MTGIIAQGRTLKQRIIDAPKDIIGYFTYPIQDVLNHFYQSFSNTKKGAIKTYKLVSYNFKETYDRIKNPDTKLIHKILSLLSGFLAIIVNIAGFVLISGILSSLAQIAIGIRGLYTHLLIRPAIAIGSFFLPKGWVDSIYNQHNKQKDASFLDRAYSIIRKIFTTIVAEKYTADIREDELNKRKMNEFYAYFINTLHIDGKIDQINVLKNNYKQFLEYYDLDNKKDNSGINKLLDNKQADAENEDTLEAKFNEYKNAHIAAARDVYLPWTNIYDLDAKHIKKHAPKKSIKKTSI